MSFRCGLCEEKSYTASITLSTCCIRFLPLGDDIFDERIFLLNQITQSSVYQSNNLLIHA